MIFRGDRGESVHGRSCPLFTKVRSMLRSMIVSEMVGLVIAALLPRRSPQNPLGTLNNSASLHWLNLWSVPRDDGD